MMWKKILLALLLIVCGVIVYWQMDWLFVNPFQEYEYSGIVYATKTIDGDTIILDDSGGSLLKVNILNELEWAVGASEDGFYEGKKVITDSEGNIYVQDITRTDDGIRICEDRIIKYDPMGLSCEVVMDYEYEEPVLVSEVIGLYEVEQQIVYIRKTDDELEIYGLDGSLWKTCAIPDAGRLIASAALGEHVDELYYITYQGYVMQYQEKGEDLVLYDANKFKEYASIELAPYQEMSIPKDLGYYNGCLYWTDLGFRDVCMCDEHGVVTRIPDDELELFDKEIPYFLNTNNGVIAIVELAVRELADGGFTYNASCSFSMRQKAVCIGVWIAFIVGGVCALLFAFMGIRYLIYKSSKYTKLGAGMILGVAVVTTILLVIILPQFEDKVYETILERALLASNVTTNELDVDCLLDIDAPEKFMGESYESVRKTVNDIFLSGDESISDLYCQIYTIQNDIVTAVYCIQEDTGAVYPYGWRYEDSDEEYVLTTHEVKVFTSISSEGSYLSLYQPILDEDGTAVGIMEVGTNLDSFRSEFYTMVLQLLINIIAITVVLILTALELIYYIQGIDEYRQLYGRGNNMDITVIPNGILRIVVFLIFFLTNLATGFLPLYAMNLGGGELSGLLSESTIAAIPLSAEVVGGAIFSVTGSGVIRFLGQKKTMYLSAFLFITGFALRIVPNIWLLIIGNAVIGIGWGIILLVINTLIANEEEEEKNQGFSYYSSAALNGANCGVVFGGFMMNWFSYRSIFILSTILSLLMFFFVRKYLLKGVQYEKEEKDASEMSFFQFMAHSKVFTFLLLIVLPVIACGYFLNYMFPILGTEYGLSDTNVSYSYLLNGLCVMLFSEGLTNVLSKGRRKQHGLLLATVLYGLAFGCVAYFQNIPSLMAALVLLGLSDSFGLPLQSSYYTDLPEAKKFGYDRAIGVYSLFENTAQAMGSFLFSFVLIYGVAAGLRTVTIIIVGMAVIFWVISLFGKKAQTA